MIGMRLDPQFCERLNFALLHSLWFIAALVIAAQLVLDTPKKCTAHGRYLVLLATQLLSLLAFVTLVVIGPFHAASHSAVLGAPSNAAGVPNQPQDSLPSNADHILPPLRPNTGIAPIDPSALIPLFYLGGTGMMLLRLLAGLYGGRQYLRVSKPITQTHVLRAIAMASEAMEIGYTPAIAYCSSVVVPSVVGVIRPTLLLPFSVLLGLTNEQIKVLVMHELAHIRRHDHLINLFQRIMGAVLFYHPAVWYLSRRIADEREMCCDDLVLLAGGQADHYARSLIRMAEIGSENPLSDTLVVSLAATGRRASLRARVIRLLDQQQSPPIHLRQATAVLISAMGIVLIASASAFAMLSGKGLKMGKEPNAMKTLTGSSASNFEPLISPDWLALHKAVVLGSIDEVSHLLKQRVNVNAVQKGGWTPLHYAVAINRTEIIGLLLDAGADPNAQSEEGRTPLHAALGLGPSILASKRSYEYTTVKQLLDRGANPNVPDKNGLTPLHDAALFRRNDAVAAFLNHQGQVNAVDGNGRTPLHHACSVAEPELIQLFLSHGANANAPENRGWTPMDMLGIQTRQWTSDVERRVADSAKILSSYGGKGSLTAIVSLGMEPEARRALIANPSLANELPARTLDGNKLLHWAVLSGNATMCQLLVEFGADVNEPNRAKAPPLYLACARPAAAIEAIKVLIQAGATLNPAEAEQSGLFAAVFQPNPEVVQLLLSSGARADRLDSSGQTLLHRVAFADSSKPNPAFINMAQMLVDNKADLNKGDNKGIRPLHLAVGGSRGPLIDLLLSAGANPNVSDQSGRTPLLMAVSVEHPNKSIIQALIQHGADPGTRDSAGRSAVDIAKGLEDPAIAELLKSPRADPNSGRE